MTDEEQLAAITGVPERASVFIVQPGEYGLDGNVIAVAESESAADLSNALQEGLKQFVRRRNDHASLRAGLRKGIEWQEEHIEVRNQPLLDTNRRRRGRRR